MTDLLGPASAPNATTARPSDTRTFGGSDTWMKPCTSADLRNGTRVEASFLNGLLGQFRSAIRGQQITIDNTDDTMLLQAINAAGIRFAADTGTANAIAIAPLPAVTSLLDGDAFWVTAAAAPTGTTTVAVSGLTPRGLRRVDGSLIRSGDWVVGEMLLMVYQGGLFYLRKAFGRKYLTAATTFYVATTGSDVTGDGSAGAPWATIQNAITQLQTNYDLGGNLITISVANGAYAGFNVTGPFVGGRVKISGNVATPASCTLTSATDTVYGSDSAFFYLEGFDISSTGGSLVKAFRGSKIIISGAMRYGAATAAQLYALDAGSHILILTSYTIYGSAPYHWQSTFGNAEISLIASPTITLTGTPAFSAAFASASDASVIRTPNVVFTGSATGTRYSSLSGGIIETAGGGASYLPGSVAGSATTGQYV